MSYCRFAWDGSDVYVYRSGVGIECCGCRLGVSAHADPDAPTGFVAETPEAMMVHLGQHRRHGDFVPAYVVEELWNEIPGATVPREPEPDAMVIARLEMEAASIRHRAGEMRQKLDALQADARDREFGHIRPSPLSGADYDGD